MDFVEALELQRSVSAFHLKNSETHPKFLIYDTQNEGYVVCAKASSMSKEYRIFLKNIVKTRNLGIRELKGYLVIYSA